MEVPEDKIKESLNVSGRHVSMDAPLREGETSTLYDVVNANESPRPDKGLMKASLNVEINRALNTLSEKEAEVIKNYYGISNSQPMSLEEIGEAFGLTRERVRQIKEKGIRRLRHTSKSKVLKTYLG